MIDDKKIEAAANKHIETEYARYNSGEVEDEMICLRGKDSFKEGAKWAINEFLKDLWHYSNKEKPQIGKPILTYTMYGYETLTYNGEGEIDCGTNWNDIISDMAVASWCYIDDIHKGRKLAWKNLKLEKNLNL